MENLLQWPWTRFDRFYEAAQKRHLVDGIERRKEAMIAALWANSNYDGGEDGTNPRAEAIEDLEESCADAVQFIQTGIDPNAEVEVEDTYGFFAAGKKGQDRIHATVPSDDASVKDVIDYTQHIDQVG